MKTSTVVEAKAHFSALLADVASGNQVVVTRRGQPVARIVPVLSAQRPFDLAALRAYVEEHREQPGLTVADMRANDQL